MFLNILSFSCFIVTMWALGDKTERDGLAPRDIAALPAVLFLLLYAFYLVECYRSTTRRCLSVVKNESAMTFIDSIRKQKPVILFKATGWHYEKKQRSIPYRDARGKLRERIESYQERVVTFDETEAFSFTEWTDITELPERFENYSLTRMEMKKEFHFADESTKNLFKNLSCAFQARNRHRERYMDYEEVVVIDGFEDHVIAYVDPLKKEWWIVTKWYWIFSSLLMSSVFRWMIAKRTRQFSVTISKQVVVSF